MVILGMYEEKTMKTKTVIVLGAVVLTGLLLAACGQAAQQEPGDPLVGDAPQQQEGVPNENVEVLEAEALPTSPPESGPVDVKATPRSGLSATNPSTVVLASGGQQVIEFFAFW